MNKRIARRFAGISVLSLAVLSGCTSNEDRSRMEQAAKENVSLKGELTDLNKEH